MLSPESLVLLGKNVGMQGDRILLLLAVAVIISAMCASIINSSYLPIHASGGTRLIGKEVGKVCALSLTLAGRLSVTLLASCGMLVTAGFAFNEIFVYWFPNFAFATILLVIIILVNLMSRRWYQAAQILFVSVVVAGLVALSLLGLFQGEGVLAEGGREPTTISFMAAVSGLLLFLGYDLTLFTEKREKVSPAFLALFIAFCIYFIWSVLSVKYVVLSKLAESTVPHLMVARNSNGPMGRFVMGAVIVSGTCAAVNAFFIFTRATLCQLAGEGLFPKWLGSFRQGRLLPVLFGVSVCVMMFTGLAGEEELEIYLRASLLLWLLHISLHCYAASRYLFRLGRKTVAHGFIVSIVLMGAFLYLLLADEHAGELVRFCLFTLSVSFFFSLVWIGVNRKKISMVCKSKGGTQ